MPPQIRAVLVAKEEPTRYEAGGHNVTSDWCMLESFIHPSIFHTLFMAVEGWSLEAGCTLAANLMKCYHRVK